MRSGRIGHDDVALSSSLQQHDEAGGRWGPALGGRQVVVTVATIFP